MEDVALWLKEVVYEDAEVEPLVAWILRMKFMGAVGLASARLNKPEVEVADGGKGCCGYMFVRRGDCC